MLTVHAMLRAPLAVAHWLGAAGRKTGGEDIIFLCHGTPRHIATQLERQLRYLRWKVNRQAAPTAEVSRRHRLIGAGTPAL